MRDTESGSFRLALGSFVEEYNNQVQVRWARGEVVDPRRRRGRRPGTGGGGGGGQGGRPPRRAMRRRSACPFVSDDMACVACWEMPVCFPSLHGEVYASLTRLCVALCLPSSSDPPLCSSRLPLFLFSSLSSLLHYNGLWVVVGYIPSVVVNCTCVRICACVCACVRVCVCVCDRLCNWMTTRSRS